MENDGVLSGEWVTLQTWYVASNLTLSTLLRADPAGTEHYILFFFLHKKRRQMQRLSEASFSLRSSQNIQIRTECTSTDPIRTGMRGKVLRQLIRTPHNQTPTDKPMMQEELWHVDFYKLSAKHPSVAKRTTFSLTWTFGFSARWRFNFPEQVNFLPS